MARSISTPPGQDASPSQVTSQQFVRFPQQFSRTHLYSWVERGTVRVECLAQEHNTMSPARTRTRTAHSLAGTSALTIKPLRLPQNGHKLCIFCFQKLADMAQVPYNKPLTNLASSSRTLEYWPLVVFVQTSGQYSPVWRSRLVSKRLIFIVIYLVTTKVMKC